MKLTKRRSSPYLPVPVPSTLWISDSHHPSPIPNTTPLASQSTTSLIPKIKAARIPFRRRGESAGPELLRSNANNNGDFGTDYDYNYAVEAQAQTRTQQTQTGGIGYENVFIPSYDDYHRRPLYSRSISAVVLGADKDMSMAEDEEDHGRRRERCSTGQNRYPPNSLAPGSGWGFGRMRRARKQDLQIAMPVRRESAWTGNASASRSEPYLPSPPISPTPLCPSTEEAANAALPVLPSSPLSPNSTGHVVPGPSAFTRHLSCIIDKAENMDMESIRPGSPSSLTRSASLSETVASGESSHSLINSLRRRSISLAVPVPRFRKDSESPRKLQTRRTGSHDPIPRIDSTPLRNHLHLQEVTDMERKEDQGTPLTSTIAEGQEISSEIENAWTLARNSSTSTTASSMIAPSTEESTVLTPPYHAIGDNRGSGDTWDAIDIPTVSRSSTVSYISGDDDAEAEGKGLNMMDMKQILLEGSDAELAAIPIQRPVVRQQASFLSGNTIMPSPSPETELEPEAAQTPSPASTHPGVDFTASPSTDSTSPTASPARTISSSSSPATRGRYTNFRSRASSITGTSTHRASEYSTTSIGEVGVANTGSMTPATIVHLVPVDTNSLSPPSARPGVQRSKSEIGHPLSKALAPFLSKESLRSTPNVTIPIPGPSKPTRPKPSPRLSLPLLSIEPAEVFAELEPEREKKPFSPSRSMSLGKLWRRISTSRRKSKVSSGTTVSTIPKSVSCVDVSNSRDIVESPTSTFRLPLDEIIPEVPTPTPRTSSLTAMRLQPPSATVSFASWSTASIDEHGRKPIAPRKSSLSTPPSLMVSDYSHPTSYFPQGLTGSSFPRAAEAPSTRTIMEGVTLVSTPDLTPGDENVDPSSPDTSPPRVARRRLDQRRARFSVSGSESTPTLEERKKYRQTLVDIQDDAVFHQVLQDLARLEKQDDDERERQSRDDALDEKDEVREEWKPDKGEIRAWFVTRELVQGERRHGRLLARGVATVQAAAESRRDEVPPLPVPGTPDRSHSAINIPQHPSRTSFLYRRQTTSRSTTSMSNSNPTSTASSSSTHLSPLSINISPRLRSRPLPAQAPPSPTTSPLELLLERLPRLLALSLTLSSRFEDDPSPYGVAEAFVKMEDEMITEIGLWAGEVGNIVAVGMGEMLDMSAPRGRSRRSVSGDAVTDDESQEDRLGFADIIIMPIQRAARYKLLFQEMLTITSPSTRSYITVSQALVSADKLAAECDRRQVFDLHAVRRQNHGSQSTKKKGKKRPRSVGVNIPSRNDRSKEKTWAGRAVEA